MRTKNCSRSGKIHVSQEQNRIRHLLLLGYVPLCVVAQLSFRQVVSMVCEKLWICCLSSAVGDWNTRISESKVKGRHGQKIEY